MTRLKVLLNNTIGLMNKYQMIVYVGFFAISLSVRFFTKDIVEHHKHYDYSTYNVYSCDSTIVKENIKRFATSKD